MANYTFSYVITEKIMNFNGETPTPFYRKQEKRGLPISYESLVAEMVSVEGLTRSDIIAVVSALEDAIKRKIAQGHAVNVGYLGTFTPFIESKLHATPAQAEADRDVTLRCRFRPSVSFKSYLKGHVSFRKYVSAHH
jgi:nucleoid DNA-binding protein